MRVAVLALFVMTAASCTRVPTKQFVMLAEAMQLQEGVWSDIEAPEPLRTSSYHHQVCLIPAAPFGLSEDPMGILDPDGEPVGLEVLASGGAGDLELPLAGYQDDRICFGVSDLELDLQFSRVRLRATSMLRVERVEWQSTDK